MRIFCKILPLVLLASAFSLSSCVNEVKKPVKTQIQDTLSQLKIVYSIPDSNQILTVNFHALMTPPWQKNYRIDWNFGDSTGVISKFDISNLTHYYQKYGSYLVTLSVFDTVSKTVLGETSALLDLEDNTIDTNLLHKLTNFSLFFLCSCNFANFGVREGT
ncbi:MAG: PKD domain-containing protein, partial [Candidatus Kapaibacterium sp.]